MVDLTRLVCRLWAIGVIVWVNLGVWGWKEITVEEMLRVLVMGIALLLWVVAGGLED